MLGRLPKLALLFMVVRLAASDPRASVSIYMPPEKLAAVSPVVVEGTVTQTASGYDPVTGALATYVTLQVGAVHRGPSELATLVIREPGGRYGSLANDVDAVPVYQPGERVLAFLEPARDGALRTVGMFYGKYRLLEQETGRGLRAARDLSGQGLIFGRKPGAREELPLSDLVSLLVSIPFDPTGASLPRTAARRALPRRRMSERWSSQPPELRRLLWDEAKGLDDGAARPAHSAGSAVLDRMGQAPGPALPAFIPLSPANPARWEETDSATPVLLDIERARNPLGDPVAAVAEIERAMAAWTDVPEARIVLRGGNLDAAFTSANPTSPASAFPPSNIVLFGDPYNDISDPVGCGGVLAIGGYWRSTQMGRTVNDVGFYPARRLYVIFNNNFECFLGGDKNLAEVAAHELGHGIGFGHSSELDAIMRAFAYGNRGPRLGNDDRDAAHCHYPHSLTLVSPNGGESWSAGTVHTVAWTSSSELGPDAGTVDLEYSTDGGTSWSVARTNEPNDGALGFAVPQVATHAARVRLIRPNRLASTPSPYPAACTRDMSDGNFSVTSTAGTVPDGSSGSPLLVTKESSGDLTWTWGASCSAGATDYAVYEGSLSALRAGSWDHSPLTCSAGADLVETVPPGADDRYYLVSALAGSVEGSLGLTSSGSSRPASTVACGMRETSSCP